MQALCSSLINEISILITIYNIGEIPISETISPFRIKPDPNRTAFFRIISILAKFINIKFKLSILNFYLFLQLLTFTDTEVT